ncbi:MAG: hypothetical protein N3F66_05655 [Spirochaetes bacterium]|nr:hypothetical protein [Spirochaetota bacterium]
MLVVILGFLVVAIILRSNGKYYIAANVSVTGTVIALGLLVNFGTMAHNEGIVLNMQQSSVNALVMKTSKEVKTRAEEIRNASEEQKNASAEIVKSISGINELTQANASGALSLAESSESILFMSYVLRQNVAAIEIS